MHIEHTILASQLHDMWLHRTGEAHVAPAFFLYNGIATAMHVTEESALEGDYRVPNPCFVDGRGLPFLRYEGKLPEASSIWNVFTGQQIEFSRFTLADHRKTVRELLEAVGAPNEWMSDVPA